ncbi:MAG TPA: glycosyltransferase family 4 protein [Anaerolineales bacterium]|nr:glycosyltransferase family 4 protein [Anaerolineales bacterium]
MENRKTVLFLDHSPVLGGAEFSLIQLMIGLDSRGWDVHLACPQGQLFDKTAERSLHAHVINFPRLRRSMRFWKDINKTPFQIYKLASKLEARCLVANTVRAAIFTRFSSSRFRLPWIWYMRDFWLSESRPRYPQWDYLGKRILGSNAAQIITNSHAVSENLHLKEKVRVVHNGIDVDAYIPQANQEFLQKYNIPRDAVVISMAARLRPWKGTDRFIRMAAELVKEHQNVYFLVVGGTPFEIADGYAESLLDLAKTLGVADKCIFTGQLNDIRPALSATDVFVHPGDPEPFGRVIIEAMAMQLPVVAFNHGAAPEIILNEKTGKLVAPGDENGLLRAVLELMRSPVKRIQFGIAGRAHTEKAFDENRMIEEVSSILLENFRFRS